MRYAVVFCVAFYCSVYCLAAERSFNGVHYFDLPEQSLTQGLVEFALQANVAVIADNALLKGHTTTPLIGPFNTDKALTLLIAKASLQARFDAVSEAFIIEPLGIMDVPELLAAANPEVVALEEVVVTGRFISPRYPTIVNSQLRNGVSVFDSSRVHQLVPQALMQDVIPNQLLDVLSYISGITPGDGFAGSNDDFYIRGFPRQALHVDGYKLSDATAVQMMPEHVERIEVLKGPSTLFYGQADAGGIANVIRKKPLDVTQFAGGASAGSEQQRKLSLDANMANIWSEDLDARLIYSVSSLAENGVAQDITRQVFSPSVRWHAGLNTVLDVQYEYQNFAQTINRDFTILNDFEDLLASRTLAQSVQYLRPEFTADAQLLHASLNHYINSQWRASGYYRWHDESRYGVRADTRVLSQTSALVPQESFGFDDLWLNIAGQLSIPILSRSDGLAFGTVLRLYDELAHETGMAFGGELNGDVSIGEHRHRVTLGAELYYADNYQAYTVESRSPKQVGALPEALFLQRLQGLADDLLATKGPLGSLNTYSQRLVYEDVGVYGQLHSQWSRRWSSSAGLRYSLLSGHYQGALGKAEQPLESYRDIALQLGAVYQPVDEASFFVNYSESVAINYGLSGLGLQAGAPESAAQWELGVKSLLFEGRLTATVAIFDIQKDNVAHLYRDALSSDAIALFHSQASQGVETDLTWQWSDHVQMLAAFSWIDPRIVSGEFDGHYPVMAADQTGSFFARRELGAWSLSAGYHYVSERSIDIQNTQKLNAYNTWDGTVDYRFAWQGLDVKAALVGRNLLDKDYQAAAVIGSHIHAGPGRSVQLSLSAVF